MNPAIEPITDMTADELRHISRKLTTFADIYTGDKEARRMARRCWEVAALLDAANALKLSLYQPTGTDSQ
jgi:hypothetical protein